MRPPANKAKLHTDTYTRTDTNTDSALISSESTEQKPQKMPETPATTLFKLLCLVQPRGAADKV